MLQTITLITGNPKKAEQISLHLDFPIAHRALDIEEIQSLDVEEIATRKAIAAYKIIKTPVLVEDTGLTFQALNGLPGPFIKWFLKTIGSDGLCRLIPEKMDRGATATTCVALCDENGVKTFTGTTAGHVAKTPQGQTDFGWNNVFIPTGSEQSWEEMSADDVAKDSMRLKALQQLRAYLTEHYSV